MKIDPNIKQEIFTDQQRFKQILINLLRNSQKFTFEGYIKLSAESILVQEDESGAMSDFLLIKIKDTGVGIKNEDKKKLF
jgi:two-component system sensor histidine kinase EvgS